MGYVDVDHSIEASLIQFVRFDAARVLPCDPACPISVIRNWKRSTAAFQGATAFMPYALAEAKHLESEPRLSSQMGGSHKALACANMIIGVEAGSKVEGRGIRCANHRPMLQLIHLR